jgi:hypothetical protein
MLLQKEAGNVMKYNDLLIEEQRMWNMKVKVIATIIGTTGNFRFQVFRRHWYTTQRKIVGDGRFGKSTHIGEDTNLALHSISKAFFMKALHESLRDKVWPCLMDMTPCAVV